MQCQVDQCRHRRSLDVKTYLHTILKPLRQEQMDWSGHDSVIFPLFRSIARRERERGIYPESRWK